MPAVQLGTFEGPLDLLMHLVRQGEMDILDLPMTLLCEQYLAHLTAMEALDLHIAGEFFVMAATLLEIKSRLLLPPVVSEEEEAPGEDGEGDVADPRTELVERLLAYGQFQAIAESLREAEAERRNLFFRPPTEYSDRFAVPPQFGTMSAEQLRKTLERLLASVGAGERAVTSVRRQKITLRMKMREIESRARQAGGGGLLLVELLPEPPFILLDAVLVFLALLELMKMNVVTVAQELFCGEIRVFFLPEPERTQVGEAAQA